MATAEPIPTGATVAVRHEAGSETGTVLAAGRDAAFPSYLIRFADRTEGWFPAFRVSPSPECGDCCDTIDEIDLAFHDGEPYHAGCIPQPSDEPRDRDDRRTWSLLA